MIESEVTAHLSSWRLLRPSVDVFHCLDFCRTGTYCYRFFGEVDTFLHQNIKKDFQVWEFHLYTFCCWVDKTGAGRTNITQHQQFPRTDDVMLFALRWDVCLLVLAGLGHFDLDAVLTANTSDSISENNLINSWEEADIYNKSAAAKGPPSLQHTQHINPSTKLHKSRHYLQIQRCSKACHAADRVNEKSTVTMASIQKVLRTFDTTYKFDVLFLNGAAESKGQKTHKIPPSLSPVGLSAHSTVSDDSGSKAWEKCFIITCFPILPEKKLNIADN